MSSPAEAFVDTKHPLTYTFRWENMILGGRVEVYCNGKKVCVVDKWGTLGMITGLPYSLDVVNAARDWAGWIYPEELVEPPASNGPERYVLAQDGSSHWYLVPADRLDDFNKWASLDEENPEAWEPPTYTRAVGGSPQLVSFTDPELAQ